MDGKSPNFFQLFDGQFLSPPRLSAFTGLGLGKVVMVSKIGNLWFIYG
jgi:hypothetical protein